MKTVPARDLLRLHDIHSAVVEFANTLLVSDNHGLEPGLRTLLAATGAEAICVEREILDEHGVSVVSEARVDRRTTTDGHQVQARVPILVTGRLAGEVIFAGVDRSWTDREVDVLRSVGRLIGTAWERRDLEADARARCDAFDRARDFEVRASRAFLKSARSVLIGVSETEGHAAVEALRTALRAAVVYVDPVHATMDEDNVMSSFLSASPQARESGLPLWLQTISWAELPGPSRRLAAGEMVIIGDPDSIDYRAVRRPRSGCPFVKTEMAVPVNVGGEWAATLGLADTVERFWTEDHRAMAAVFAELFGAFYERRSHRNSLLCEIASLKARLEN